MRVHPRAQLVIGGRQCIHSPKKRHFVSMLPEYILQYLVWCVGSQESSQWCCEEEVQWQRQRQDSGSIIALAPWYKHTRVRTRVHTRVLVHTCTL